MLTSTDNIPIHDVLIIGAGPCGLAVAARLCEPLPSALFTENEHQKFHFLQASSRRRTKHMRTSRRANTATDRLLSGPCVSRSGLDIKVLDANRDQWMSSWDERFRALDISHLRSPMFFHPDPQDRDGLLAFAYRNGREQELKEIQGVVGKELSKHHRKKKLSGVKRTQETTYIDERNRQDYFRPSQALFHDYCQDVVQRYDLADLVEESRVTSISYDAPTSLFTVHSSNSIKKARIVVLAVGSGQEPRIPADSLFHNMADPQNVSHVFSRPGLTATSTFQHSQSPNPTNIDGRTMAIVGGGLTSAQIAQLTSSRRTSKIHLILRGPLKTKHFDVDLCWLAKFKNDSMSRFWKADGDEERWEMIKEARGGGSVNPEFRDLVKKLIKDGTLVLWEWTKIEKAEWNEEDQSWTLGLLGRDGLVERVHVDEVVYATGEVAGIGQLEMMRPILKEHPVEIVGGMPCLTSELMWNEDVPLFLTGKMGGLRLGPAASNLEGARIGAEFIASRIATLAKGWQEIDTGDEAFEDDIDMGRLGLGRSNQFETLDDGDDGGSML